MRKFFLTAVLTVGCGSSHGIHDSGVRAPDFSDLRDGSTDTGDLAFAEPDLPPSSQCLGGHYVGTFDGQILLGNVFPLKTHGTVDLTLMQSGGEFFAIMNGHLMGDASGNPYSSDLVGMLDCAALKLTGGMIKNGQVTVNGLKYMFEGPLAADYDPQTVSFVHGTWNIKQIPTPSSSGMGTWKATHM